MSPARRLQHLCRDHSKYADEPNETINYSGALGPGPLTVSPAIQRTPLDGYFGQKYVTNNATAVWDASSRATLSLTYRYRTHSIVQAM